jgi:hypothetical protein
MRHLALLTALLVGCGGGSPEEPCWTVTSIREQFDIREAGCLRVCVESGVGCAMLDLDGEHVTCADGPDPLLADNGSFGTCVVTIERNYPCR